NPTEAEVLLAAAGDREAFARLVTATRSLVSSIALCELRDVEAARDVAQDVYLQVWDDLHALRNPSSFLPFLRQVTRLRARRVAERRGRELVGPDADAALAGAVDPALDPRTSLLREEQANVVREALESLPEDARETLTLYYLEGHSAAQVARLLGLSEQAVYQRLSRARAHLRADLLARLGDTLTAAAPGAAFTAAVLGALPSPAAAQGGGAAMAAAASSVAGKATAVGGLVTALVLVLVLGSITRSGPPAGQGGGGNIARPVAPVTRDDSRPEPAADEAPLTSGLDVRVTGPGDAPLAGAEVRLYRRVPVDAGTGRPAWQVTRTVKTGADGRIRLPADPGAWLVTGRSAGFAPGQVELVHPSGVDFTVVEVALAPRATLPGRVVARPSGEAVPLAAIWLERESSLGPDAANFPIEERFGATAGPRGEFAVGGLAPGRYRLVAEAAGHARTVLRQVAVPRPSPLVVELGAAGVIEGMVRQADGRPASGAEVSFIGGSELVTVTAGPRGGYSAEVVPASYRVVAVRGRETGAFPSLVSVTAGGTATADVQLGQGAVVAGRAMDGAGAPVAGAQAVLTAGGAYGELGRALSGPDGRFEIGPLPGGECDLDVVADGHSPASRSGLVVLPGQRFEIDVRLDGVGSVEGVVCDQDGAPIPGARVTGGKMWGGAMGSVPAEAVAGADGRYLLPALEVGVASIRARRPGVRTGDGRPVTIEAGRRSTADFVLPATGVLEGEVRFADGRPADGSVRVQVARDAPMIRREDMVRVEVGADGRYGIDLPAGEYRAFAVHDRIVDPGKWLKAKVVEGETARLDLVTGMEGDDPAAVAVEVREPGGAPAAHARVGVAGSGFQMQVGADETGRVRVRRAPGGGPTTIEASNGGRVAPPVEVADGVKDLVIDLRAAASVRGRVVAAGGAGVAGFTLDVETADAQPFRLGQSTRRIFGGDRFELSDLPAKALRLVATTPDGRVGEVALSPSPGEAVLRDIAVQPGGVIRVRPVGPDGRPVDGAYVIIGSRMVDTAMDGIFYAGGGSKGGGDRGALPPGTVVVEDVAAGRRTIRVGARSHHEVVVEVDVAPGQVIDLGTVQVAPVEGTAR
ncbi:MAG TPA: sigma-70 family RNA polymerase sigma factor, partial [Anaeromyxobacteraceae bacterium]|nr:sigma-70 family RNA polymerase sigma factor [Anaeromyxobacteraceae bacterium]